MIARRAILVLAALVTLHQAPVRALEPSYRIEARLDPDQHRVLGKQQLRFTNTSPQPIPALVFHLYMNAFSSDETRFFRHTGGQHRQQRPSQDERGKIQVTRLKQGSVDLLPRLVVDETLASLPLPTPLAPGATLELELEFETTLPRVWARTGYFGTFFAVGQWFPKLAVFDCPPLPGCGFVAQQLSAWTEFYADFGDYEVTVDAPVDYVLAGCGVIASDAQAAGRRRTRFIATRVHDFSWFASPDFVRHRRTVTVGGRRIELELFAASGTRASVDRHLAAVELGLQELGRLLLPYPYPKLTIVLPPVGGAGAGGMEYPTLITGFASPSPALLRADELVALHELTHQYFYGLLASNEPEEAWLDEGLTEFVSSRIVDEQLGGIFAWGPLHVTMAVGHWLASVTRAAHWPIAMPVYGYPTSGSFSSTTYSKTARVLQVWQARIGRERFDERLRGYAIAQQFRHPTRRDLVAHLAVTPDERALLDGLLTLREPIDYAVTALHCEAKTCQAIVERSGPALDDVSLDVRFADGHTDEHRWTLADQRAQSSLALALPSDVVEVALRSPLGLLDAHPSNDARRVTPDPRPRATLARGVALLASLLLALVGP